MEWCICAMSPPPLSAVLSLCMVVKSSMSGFLRFEFSLVSWIVTIFGFVVLMSCVSSVILFLMPFMLSCNILKTLG